VKKLLLLAVLFVVPIAWAANDAKVQHHRASYTSTATFQFIDYTVCEPIFNFFPSPPITATATQTTAYLDCGGSGGPPIKPIPLANGVTDGQLLTLVCNSALAGQWTIGGSFDVIDGLVLGGSNLGSFDLGLTVNPGNGSSSSDQSCGATLMWSDGNQWWELVTIYGGTDN
jgi:hypothetical protein